MLNCVAGGRLLKTDDDCERCAHILAQIDPEYFQDEFRVFSKRATRRDARKASNSRISCARARTTP